MDLAPFTGGAPKAQKRFFTVVRSTVKSTGGGRYESTTPSAAGRKAGKQLMAVAAASRPTNTVVLELRETSRSSKGDKRFFYRVTRLEAKKTVPSKLGFNIKWEYKVSKATEADRAQLENVSPSE